MLNKVLNVEGLGLLHNVKTGSKIPFSKVTLVYGENGRGKSTFTSLLTSCSTQDSNLIEDRVTIDSNVKPAAKLMFGNSEATYKDGSWAGYRPEILVYDGNFVNENVHAGSEVTTDQRAKLLDFALGETAVKARAAEQKATVAEQQASQDLKRIRQQLDTLVGGAMLVPQFRSLSVDEHIDKKIDEVKQKHAAITRAEEIKRQTLPQEMNVSKLNISQIFSVLGRTLESVHAEAAAKVSEHMGHLKDLNSAKWIQNGLALAADEHCPFCGQDISQVDLIEMYRTYFDRAYTDLQKDLTSLVSEVLPLVDPSSVDKYAALRKRNNEIIQQWAEYVRLTPLQNDDDLARASLENLQDLLETLLVRKSAAITESHGSVDDLEETKRLWEQVTTLYDDENSVIVGYREDIERYKLTLDATTVDQSNAELQRLKLTKLRHDPSTEKIVSEAEDAESRLKEAEKAKKSSRDQLNLIMQSTLLRFKDSINQHLEDFNAEFKIAEFSHNYRGRTPRVEYQILLREEKIELTGGRPTFATALSEGDKKTMGFAFFAASTLADPGLDKKIVVIDDPMSSLDVNRKDHTLEVIQRIANTADQVILMAHDEHFLRSMRERVIRAGNVPNIAEVELRMAKDRYSEFGVLDLDGRCESEYLRHYKLVTGVTSGVLNDVSVVAHGAVALRPLLEGYLHRKYPGVIPTGITLGQAITSIEESEGTNSPCAAMFSRIKELREMNDYSSRFHHNTSPDMGAASRESHQAIVKNGEKILRFIHTA